MEKVIRDANGERVYVGDLVSYNDGTPDVYRVEALGDFPGAMTLSRLQERSGRARTFELGATHARVVCSASQWEERPTDLSQALHLLDRVDYFADQLSSDNCHQERGILGVTDKLRAILKGMEA